jgi:hypothetical protein
MSKEGKNHRLVVIIDGLNSLDHRDNAMDLVWLPLTFPKNVKLIVSCSPGMPSLKKMGENFGEYDFLKFFVPPEGISNFFFLSKLFFSGKAIFKFLISSGSS